ncbi:retrovirus-related pol polyprotein from transposon TNT 1-94 [Tanacetum coccineum]
MTYSSPISLIACATSTKSWLWHQRLSHLNFDTVDKLAKDNIVTSLPKFKYSKDHLCPSEHNSGIVCLRLTLNMLALPTKRRLIYNRMTKKVMETTNVTFDELSAMVFEYHSSNPRLQGKTFGHISSGVELTYAPSTITPQKPTGRDFELLLESMYDDYMGGQPSYATSIAHEEPATLNRQTPNASTKNCRNCTDTKKFI